MLVGRDFRQAAWVTGFICLVAAGGCRRGPDFDQVGGTVLAYAVQPGEDGQALTLSEADRQRMIAVLQRRLDPDGRQGIRVSFSAAGFVNIALPGQDPQQIARAEQRVAGQGKLEFLIVATERDHAKLVELARQTKTQLIRQDDRVVGRWVDVGRTQGGSGFEHVWIDGNVLRDGATGQVLEFDEQERDQVRRNPQKLPELLQERGVKDLEVLVVLDPDPAFNVQGKHFGRVTAAYDETGYPCLNFTMTSEGAKVMQYVTGAHLPDQYGTIYYQLGIVFDGRLISAPRIMNTISDRGRIAGRFTKEEVDTMVAILQAGELPAALSPEPVSRQVVPPGDRAQ
jgi:SecD/SecF fusion protein